MGPFIHDSPYRSHTGSATRICMGPIWASHLEFILDPHWLPMWNPYEFETGFHVDPTWAAHLEPCITHWLLVPFDGSMLMVVENVNIASYKNVWHSSFLYTVHVDTNKLQYQKLRSNFYLITKYYAFLQKTNTI